MWSPPTWLTPVLTWATKNRPSFWLDKALADKAGGLEAVKIVPSLAPWHSDSRYLDLLKRMGLKPWTLSAEGCSSQSEPAIRTCDQNLLPVLDAVKFRLYEYTNRFTGTV